MKTCWAEINKSFIVFLVFILAASTNSSSQVVSVKKYVLKSSPYIGTVMGVDVYEGSMGSGLYYIPGTDFEFYCNTDRGPNLFAGFKDGKPNLYMPFPSYTLKIFKIKAYHDSLLILDVIKIRRPDGKTVTGIPPPEPEYIISGESALRELDGTLLESDIWGIDPEGIAYGTDNDAWLCEEYGPSVLHIDLATGVIIKRYYPLPRSKYISPIDPILKRRLPNRGFEAITITPEGKIYAVMQSPIGNPVPDVASNSQIHRILEIDEETGVTRMLAYLHEKPEGEIKNLDIKIGDISAINDHEFLVVEISMGKTGGYNRIYKIDIEDASAVGNIYYGKYLEEWNDSAGLVKIGIAPVKKEFYFDLLANGWDAEYDKCEGLTIINNHSFAVSCDNDYSINAPNSDGVPVDTNKKTALYVYTVKGNLKLKNYFKIKH